MPFSTVASAPQVNLTTLIPKIDTTKPVLLSNGQQAWVKRIEVSNNVLASSTTVTIVAEPIASTTSTTTSVNHLPGPMLFNSVSVSNIELETTPIHVLQDAIQARLIGTPVTPGTVSYPFYPSNFFNTEFTFKIHPWDISDKKQQFKTKLRQQLYPTVRSRAVDFNSVPSSEIVALQLLKSMLEPERWKKYLKYGFVEVKAKSGLLYQIRRGQSHIIVFDQGKRLAELCVTLKNGYQIPPTDAVVTKMILAQYDEPDIWARANVYPKALPQGFTKPKDESDLKLLVAAA